jgi:hypothetical protein
MAITDFLFEGKAPPQATSYSSTSSNLPDWYQAHAQGIAAKANAIAAQPYADYAGTRPARVAGLTDDQTKAFADTRANQGMWKTGMTAAEQSANQAATPFNADIFSKFESPYLTGVTNRIAELGARNLSENLLPQIGDTFTKAGQFGSTRNADFVQRALRDTQESILGKQAETLQAGQDAAMRAYESGMGRSLAAAQQQGALAQMGQQLGLRDTAALETIGQTQQQQNQRNLDVANQDYLEKRDYDRNNIAFLNSALRGMSMPQSETKISSAPGTNFQPSPLSQFAGMATGYGGILQGMK